MHPGIAKVPPNNDANRASVSPELTNAVLPRIVGPHTMPDRLSSELKSAASTLGCGLVCGLLLGAGTLHAAAAVGALSWRQLPTLPDTEGFAGMFAGVSGGALLLAGGANFPGKKPWEGGTKVWHDTVFALDQPNGEWRQAGHLPHRMAYGVSVTTPDGVVCVGGSDAQRHHAEAFRLGRSNGRLETRPLPSLPVPLAHAAGALVGSTLLVYGGTDQPGEQVALNRLFALELTDAPLGWRELAPCPGKARLLAVATAVRGVFYFAGGVALQASEGKISRVYLQDVWSYSPAEGWRKRADLPKPCAGAATPGPGAGSRFFLVGGDDGSHVGFQPVETHPGFSRTIFAYDVVTDHWSAAGEAPLARATLPCARWGDEFVFPSGEVRPGIRSPQVWGWALTETKSGK